jgi:heme/copper-type cytochrome/quinol oxidase subunit 3
VTPDRPVLDVSQLPTHAFGARDPVWWAIVLLVGIESTVFGLTLITYFYVRGNYETWPPAGVGSPDLLSGTISAVLLFACTIPVAICSRAARKHDVRGMKLWLLVGLLVIGASLAVRCYEIEKIPFRWSDHAYGSIFWTILGLHTFHMVATIVEDAIALAILYRPGPTEEKLAVDVHVTAIYTYFVIASWIPLYAILYLERSVWP